MPPPFAPFFADAATFAPSSAAAATPFHLGTLRFGMQVGGHDAPGLQIGYPVKISPALHFARSGTCSGFFGMHTGGHDAPGLQIGYPVRISPALHFVRSGTCLGFFGMHTGGHDAPGLQMGYPVKISPALHFEPGGNANNEKAEVNPSAASQTLLN